jgi:hypothetical protein
MHKIPLTNTEKTGLIEHGLDIGTPSQLSDVFRQGIAWGQKEIALQLRKSGATLPAPAPKGTIESAINSGLCIALCVVENFINKDVN